MSYSAVYTDETGRSTQVSVSDDDSREALRNDFQKITQTYNPKYVKTQRLLASPGEAMHIRVTVNAPSHYLTSRDDTIPKKCDSMTVDIICYLGYPLKSVEAFYADNHFLASPNVYRSGHACIGNWVLFSSSLTTVVDKLILDMVHDHSVTDYESIANARVVSWHKLGVSSGLFPTIPTRLLYAPELTPLPPRKTAINHVSTPARFSGGKHQ